MFEQRTKTEMTLLVSPRILNYKFHRMVLTFKFHKVLSLNFDLIFTVKTKPRFGELYTCFGCETETELGGRLCSAISFKMSHRELSIDVAQHRFMLKNYRNMHYPVLVSYPKQI